MTFRLFLKWGAWAIALVLVGCCALVYYVVHQERSYKRMADSHDLAVRVDRLGRRYLKKRPQGALVVGVIQKGERYVSGFGRVSDANSGVPDGKTIFEIGSITKVFTGILLGKMLQDQTANLDASIGAYLPSGVAAPKKDGRAITLRDLATHTSGLPRLPPDLSQICTNDDDPYAGYSSNHLYKSLGVVKLESKPGERSEYSNYGFGLLGHLLALKAGAPYEQLVRQMVCVPLRLTNTAITLTAEQKSRLTPGHNSKGRIVPNWTFDSLAGAGALKSDVEDLLNFMAANLQPGTCVLSNALQEAQRAHFGDMDDGIGLGWQITKTIAQQQIWWHNGGTGGYVSFLGFDKQADAGVVLLSNYGDAMADDDSLDQMGMELLKLASKISWK